MLPLIEEGKKAPAFALPDMEGAEADTLEFTAEEMQGASRLTCQITVREEIGGTVFQVVGR